MNKFEIRKISKNKNIDDYEIFIDGEIISQILMKQKSVQLPENVEPFDDLCLAWTKGLDFWGDVRFVWNRLGEHISAEFKKYINDELLRSNVAMCGVVPMN